MQPSLATAAARRLDHDLAGRPAAAVAPSDPHLAAWLGRLHAANGGPRVEAGVVVDVAAGAYAYLVDAGVASTVWCSPGGTTGGFGAFGGRPLTTFPVGTPVYFVRHPQTPTVGTILAAEPAWGHTSANQPADGVWPFVRSGAVDAAHRLPGDQSRALAAGDELDLGGVDLVDYAAGRPLDGTAVGEWGVMAETGVGVFADPFQAYLRVDEATGVFAFYADQLLRVAGQNYQFSTNQTEAEELDDRGELLGYVRRCVYPWEPTGLWRPNQVTPGWAAGAAGNAGLAPGQGLSFVSPTAVQEGNGYAVREPEVVDPLPAARVYEWLGYLGQGGRRVVAAPAQLDQLLPGGAGAGAAYVDLTLVGGDGAPDGRVAVDGVPGPAESPYAVPPNSRSNTVPQPGVFEEHWSLAGDYYARFARSYTLAKRVAIPVPRQVYRPEDPAGDTPDDYRPSGWEKFGVGPAHKVTTGLQPTGGGAHRVCMLPDALAYAFNWEGLAPFAYHAADWAVPQEQNVGVTGLVNQAAPTYTDLATAQYLAVPTPKYLDVDHRYRTVPVYETEAGFSILEDGGVVLYDGWGSEIRMYRGNIEFHCAGDVALFPGRNLLSWAGHDVVLRAKDSVDLTAATADLRLKAEKNLHGLAGNGGCGGFLWETKAVCPAMGFDGRPGEKATSSGFVVLAPNAQFTVQAGDVAVSLADTSSDGRIYLDAGHSRHIHTYSRTLVNRVAMNGTVVQLFDGTGVFPNPAANEFTAKGTLLGTNVYAAKPVYLADDLMVEGKVTAVGAVAGNDPAGFGGRKANTKSRLDYLTVEFRDLYDVEVVFPPHTDEAEFSLRTAAQYLSTAYEFWRPRWQTIADAAGQTPTLAQWAEPPVVGLRSETLTLPHPGERWLDAAGFRYHQAQFVNEPAGWLAIDRDANRAGYETPPAAVAGDAGLADNYGVPVPPGTEA